MARYKSTPRRRAQLRRASAKHYAANRAAIRKARKKKKDTAAKHRMRRLRERRASAWRPPKQPSREDALPVVSENRLRRPDLMYIDSSGTIRREDDRSAEQLIEDFLQQQETAKKKGSQP